MKDETSIAPSEKEGSEGERKWKKEVFYEVIFFSWYRRED